MCGGREKTEEEENRLASVFRKSDPPIPPFFYSQWMAGAPPVVQELGPYAFRVRPKKEDRQATGRFSFPFCSTTLPFFSSLQARELRWNARWSPDQVNVTFTRTFYHEVCFYGVEKGAGG